MRSSSDNTSHLSETFCIKTSVTVSLMPYHWCWYSITNTFHDVNSMSLKCEDTVSLIQYTGVSFCFMRWSQWMFWGKLVNNFTLNQRFCVKIGPTWAIWYSYFGFPNGKIYVCNFEDYGEICPHFPTRRGPVIKFGSGGRGKSVS